MMLTRHLLRSWFPTLMSNMILINSLLLHGFRTDGAAGWQGYVTFVFGCLWKDVKMPKTQRGDVFGLEVGFLTEYE